MRANLAQMIVISAGLLLSLIAQLSLGDALKPSGSPSIALLLWIAGIGLVLAALWPGFLDRLSGGGGHSGSNLGRSRSHNLASWDRWEFFGLIAISLAALLVRLVKLNEIPYVLTGDEASMGREALKVISGELANPFILGWFSHPTLYFHLLALPLKFLGQNTLALRFLSPFVGALSVSLTYVFARRAWGRPVASVSASLLAGYHFHIHFSRLALNNVWDPLFAILVLSLFWSGWKTGDRRHYLLGGLCLGVSQYFYTGARLLLILVGCLMVYWLLTKRGKLWEERVNLTAALLVAFAVCIPLALFATKHPDDYFARMNQLGIIQSGWLEREMIATGRGAPSLFTEQIWRSALAFNYTIDPTFWYRPGIPLLRFWPSIFFVFGLAIAVAASKKSAEFILLLWFGGTVLFAGALLENPPSSQRYVIAAPAVCMLIALALVWMSRRLGRLLGGSMRVWIGGALCLATLFSFNDLRFYFSDYTPRSDLGGVNTEVAQRVSEYLNDLGPEWRVYFYGSPRMGIGREHGFPSVAFLAPDANPYDVMETMTDLSHLPDLRFPATFIFLPERAFELNVVREAFPGGTEKHFPGRLERILFVALEVPG
jgi:4-amino-4-deoxy-L-arabinose transferase-like glycosyltransferase